MPAAASASASATRMAPSTSRSEYKSFVASMGRPYARPGRIELPTLGSVDQCSIQLSYGRVREAANHSQRAPRVNHALASPSTPLCRVAAWASLAGAANFSRHTLPYDSDAALVWIDLGVPC